MVRTQKVSASTQSALRTAVRVPRPAMAATSSQAAMFCAREGS
jgi:hypothetical protein